MPNVLHCLYNNYNDGILFKSAFNRKFEMPFTVSGQPFRTMFYVSMQCISVILLLCVFFSLYTHVAKIVDTPNENLILQSKTCNSYLNCVFFTQTA